MFKLTFLSAGVPLTKTIAKDGTKSTYPDVRNFSSIDIKVNNIDEFHKHLVDLAYSKVKPCLLKGNLKTQLNNEPRKGGTSPAVPTQWVCFDLDGAPFSSPDEFMHTIGLGATSYIAQYSSSHGLTKTKTLNCHIFAILNRPINPQDLKTWLMYLNLHIPVLERALRLSNQQNHLKWSLDITTCQNDKLLYIAAPIFEDPKADPLSPKKRIELVRRPDPALDVSKIALQPLAKLKKEARAKLDDLRNAIGLQPNRHKLRIVDGVSALPNADPSVYSIVNEDDEFIRLNLGANGDSCAYYIIKAKPELIRNFKGEDAVFTKDVAPDLYQHLTGNFHEQNSTPSIDGDTVIAVREKRSGKYWKGLFNASAPSLDIHEVDSKDKLFDFLLGHGLQPPPYVPEWEMIFDPHNPKIIDEDKHIINRFVPPNFPQAKGAYPIIQQCLDSAVGTGPVQEHFLNWLAVIFQHKRKCKTAWILHGTQGTGKGVLFNDVIVPMLSRNYTEHILATALNSDFDGWQENKLMVFIDEIDVDLFEKKSGVEAKLKKMITEGTDDIHRKGQTRYSTPSYVNLIFGSNKPHMIVVPFNDRRYNIGAYQKERWFPTRKQVEEDLPKELPAFYHYLMTREACIDTAGQVLQTEDRINQQKLSINSADELAHDILNGNLSKLIDYLPDSDFLGQHGMLPPTAQAYEQIIKSIVVEDLNKLSRDQLSVIFQHCIGKTSDSPNRFTSYLRHHGINLTKIKQLGTTTQGIHVNWQIDHTMRNELFKRFQPRQPLRKIK